MQKNIERMKPRHRPHHQSRDIFGDVEIWPMAFVVSISSPLVTKNLNQQAHPQRNVKPGLLGGRTQSLNYRKLVLPAKRVQLVACANEQDRTHQHSPEWNEEDSDYFGRDPRKETEFWMEHAREVLKSKEVSDAVEAHKKSGKDNLTEEQKAWLEFAKSITPPSENNNNNE